MITAMKRKVLDGLNRKYIYGRVVSTLSFCESPDQTQTDPVASYAIAPPAHDHLPH